MWGKKDGHTNDHERLSAPVAAALPERKAASARPAFAAERERCFTRTLRVWKRYAWLQGALSPVLVTPLVRGAKTNKAVMLCASLKLLDTGKSVPCQAGSVKPMKLEKVRPEQIAELHAILVACWLDMQARFGLAHWVPAYPLEAMQRDTETKRVYAVREGPSAIATFTVSAQAPAYYDMSIWQNPDARALYVHRLAVLPAYQGRGIGRWCMEQIEQLAGAEGCSAVRLDAYDEHLALHEFYRHLGYQERGSFRLMTRLYGETGGVYFEKVLRTGPG